MGNNKWETNGRVDNEQKLAWLEEEVKNLRGNQKPLDGPYWSMPVTKDRGPPADLGQQLPQQDGGPLQDARDAQPEVRCNVPKNTTRVEGCDGTSTSIEGRGLA